MLNRCYPVFFHVVDDDVDVDVDDDDDPSQENGSQKDGSAGC